jgi:hypothetical protein|tara:strand:- start:428 stop:1129 length:702 start_codon:yes stop_codon:yes gene_type:complete
MFKLNIDDVEYGFPERLTIDQWTQILKKDLSQTSTWIGVLSKLMGVHPKDLTTMSDSQLQMCMGIIFSKLEERKTAPWRDPSSLSFGEWVDLDVWINKGIGVHAKDILKILQLHKGELMADEASYIIESFITWRTWIYKQYSELFGLDLDEDDNIISQDDISVDGPIDPDEVINGWYSIIIGLAGDDLLRIDKVTDQPVLATLNFMAYQKQKTIAENFNKLKQQKQYELQRRR